MATTILSSRVVSGFPAMGARRLFVFGGIALIAGGMLFGDLFAVFALHQNGARTGDALLAAGQAAAAGDRAAVKEAFGSIANLMEDRGTKVDTHVHMSDAGYLALLLALIQPYVALSTLRKKRLAQLFITGGVLLPVGIFLIHYVGLAYSPFPVIGWASIVADSAGALLILVLIAESWGLWRYFCGAQAESEETFPQEQTWERRMLLSGGTMLVLLGFLYGGWYAAQNLREQEDRERVILKGMLDQSLGKSNLAPLVDAYGSLQAEKAVEIAAHSHIIEFGLLSILLAFVQPYVFLGAVWKRRWVKLLLMGSVILPVFVLLELKLGLLAGGIADLGGLMVIVALIGMLTGVLRSSGGIDARAGSLR
jgi:hypothetical protein